MDIIKASNLCNYHAHNIWRFSGMFEVFMSKRDLKLIVLSCNSIAQRMAKINETK